VDCRWDGVRDFSREAKGREICESRLEAADGRSVSSVPGSRVCQRKLGTSRTGRGRCAQSGGTSLKASARSPDSAASRGLAAKSGPTAHSVPEHSRQEPTLVPSRSPGDGRLLRIAPISRAVRVCLLDESDERRTGATWSARMQPAVI